MWIQKVVKLDIETFYYKSLGLDIRFYTQKKINKYLKKRFPTAKAFVIRPQVYFIGLTDPVCSSAYSNL